MIYGVVNNKILKFRSTVFYQDGWTKCSIDNGEHCTPPLIGEQREAITAPSGLRSLPQINSVDFPGECNTSEMTSLQWAKIVHLVDCKYFPRWWQQTGCGLTDRSPLVYVSNGYQLGHPQTVAIHIENTSVTRNHRGKPHRPLLCRSVLPLLCYCRIHVTIHVILTPSTWYVGHVIIHVIGGLKYVICVFDFRSIRHGVVFQTTILVYNK